MIQHERDTFSKHDIAIPRLRRYWPGGRDPRYGRTRYQAWIRRTKTDGGETDTSVLTVRSLTHASIFGGDRTVLNPFGLAIATQRSVISIERWRRSTGCIQGTHREPTRTL